MRKNSANGPVTTLTWGLSIGVCTLFLNKKFKDFSRTFKDTFPIFQGLHLVQKRALSLSFLVLPQHEQFYPEGLS